MFTIYSKPNCSFCDKAKTLLNIKGLEYSELIIETPGFAKDPSKTYVTVNDLRTKVPNARSVPQIFDGDRYIGGYEQLLEHLE